MQLPSEDELDHTQASAEHFSARARLDRLILRCLHCIKAITGFADYQSSKKVAKMLDPLTALGCASAVVQLVDFAAGIVGSSYEIFKSTSGTTQGNIHLEEIVKDLAFLGGNVQRKVTGLSSSANGDAQLLNITNRVLATTEEISRLLESLKIDRNQPFQTYQALRVAIRAVVKSDKLQALQSRLDDLRSELSLHLLYLIHNGQASVAQSLGNLSDQCQTMRLEHVDLFTNLRQELTAAIDQQGSEFRKFITTLQYIPTGDAISDDQRHEQQRQFEGMRGQDLYGNTKAIGRQTSPKDYYAQITTSAAAQLRPDVANVMGHVEDMLHGASVTSIILRVLESLRFVEMPMRHAEIPDVYKKTYRWIYQPDISPFRTWLESSGGIFWISGKAGSGKSTLLKYITGSNRTQDILRTWASSQRLCVLEFYFWNSGYPMQKTQQGLLRSLLYQILRDQPQALWSCCLERCHSDTQNPWSLKELKRALQTALRTVPLPTRFCIFIDGLDEFEGDHYTLIRYFDELSRLPKVKICVTSRPWNVFRTEYEPHPKNMLTLESLTAHDMDIYVRGMLEDDPRYRRLAASDRGARVVAQEIRERADGVFLWVFLVVRSLLRGLSDDDDVPTLQRRLRALPPDLKSYFTHMLDGVDDFYQEQTARSLLVACTTDEPCSVLTYYYLDAEASSPKLAVNTGVEAITRSEYDAKRKKATSSINKWCRDLLEVRQNPMNRSLQTVFLHKVDFLHRTVKDFLTSEEVMTLLVQRAGSDFNPRLLLCRSSLYICKFLNINSGQQDDAILARECLDRVMKLAREVERHEKMSPVDEISNVDHVGTSLCCRSKGQRRWCGSSFEAYVRSWDLDMYVQQVYPRHRSGKHAVKLSTSTIVVPVVDDLKSASDCEGLGRQDSRVRRRDKFRSMFGCSPPASVVSLS